MADVLAQIVAAKRAEVAVRLSGVDPLAAEPTTRSLRAALARPGARFVMEVKRASPSGHVARHAIDQAAVAYAPVADAVSVLTDGPYFGGSLADIAVVRALFDGPILAKDFVVDPRQVAEARLHGADAALCMLSVLGDGEAKAVLSEAERLSMDVIVEVHDAAELDRALGLGAAIVGINNRDLKSLRTDLAVTEQLARRVPPEVLLISESGIADRSDVQRLAPLVDAFLVGSSLMAADDIAEAARALVHGRVKLCGLTRVEDIRNAGLAGATHAGLIFVPGTPRALDPSLARPLADAARAAGMKPVGVFRDTPPEQVIMVADALGLAAVQLHGSESAEAIAQIRTGFAGEIWTACAPNADRPGDRLLFDSGTGGTGRAFDWSAVSGHPRLAGSFLAGGIGADNARAAEAVGAYGLDASSRIEAEPGIKDPNKIEALFAALRPDDRRMTR